MGSSVYIEVASIRFLILCQDSKDGGACVEMMMVDAVGELV